MFSFCPLANNELGCDDKEGLYISLQKSLSMPSTYWIRKKAQVAVESSFTSERCFKRMTVFALIGFKNTSFCGLWTVKSRITTVLGGYLCFQSVNRPQRLVLTNPAQPSLHFDGQKSLVSLGCHMDTNVSRDEHWTVRFWTTLAALFRFAFALPVWPTSSMSQLILFQTSSYSTRRLDSNYLTVTSQ